MRADAAAASPAAGAPGRPGKVLFVAPRPFGLGVGGQEVQVLRTAEALRALGVHVELLRPFDPAQFEGVELVHLFGCDHVHLQTARLVAARGIPLVVSPVFYKLGRELLAWSALARVPYSQADLSRRLLALAAAVLPNSAAEGRQLRRVFGVPSERIVVVPNAVDPARAAADPRAFGRRHLADWGEARFVLSAGRVERRKRSLLLLQAARRAELPVVFLGDRVPSEAAYCAEFERELARHPMARWLPAVPHGSDELAQAFAGCHVHALVSRLETPGLASLEAALHGANLVVADCAPVREYLEGCARIVRPRVEEVAAALRSALAEPRDAMGQRARVLARYTWAETARATLAGYARALGRPRA